MPTGTTAVREAATAGPVREAVVAALYRDGPATATQLCERMDRDSPRSSVSRVLRALREAGVTELYSPEAAYNNRVYGLTNDGEAVAAEVLNGDE